jgi:hypothetical protein
VHMLGHENVANESKAVARSSLLKRVNGQIASPNCVQKRPALIAAKGDEMKIAKTGDFLDFWAWGRRGAHPFQNRNGRPPRRGSLLRIVTVYK